MNTETTPYVAYNYYTQTVEGVYNKGMRLKGVRYPSTRLVHYHYGDEGSRDEMISRLATIHDDNNGLPGQTLASYSYNGVGAMVAEQFPQPDVKLDYFQGTAGTYTGFDRFARIKDQKWRYEGETPADRDRYQYGYDYNSNRMYRKNELKTDLGELYHANGVNGYDGLDRLKEFRRGKLNANKDTIADGDTTRRQVYSLDQVGNWTRFQDAAGDGDPWDLDQTRDNNLVNEITGIGQGGGQAEWKIPAHDARGNMTSGPKPSGAYTGAAVQETTKLHFKYDAWGRLASIKNDNEGVPGTLVAKYQYDALNRRIAKLVPNGNNWDRTDYYYNASWQAVEERFVADQVSETTPATAVKCQYVWSLRYIDAPVLRDRDDGEGGNLGKTDSGLEERLYYTTDANMNVTALVSTAGAVVERYVYDAYGKATVREANWTERTWADSKKNEILYCGYRYDPETGLYHVRNRMYHPTLGRWLQRDPLGYVDGMSLYEYVRSNPSGDTDPKGLWKKARHISLTEDALAAVLRTLKVAPTKKCKKYLYKTLNRANRFQDKNKKAFKENKRHFNRDYVRGETAAARLANRIAADAAYKGYIDYETAEFHRQLKAGGVDCNGALWAQGRRDHSLQDFYMHAIRRDGRGGPERGTGPGWTAWSLGVTGTPDKRDKFWPSSYNAWYGIYEGEHPNRREPVLYSSLEGRARFDAAGTYMAKEYKKKIPAWWKVCCPWCNAK